MLEGNRLHPDDTIFALASGSGRAGLAVVRISGPGAIECLTAFGVSPPKPRSAGLRSLMNGMTGASIDDCLVLVFPGPGSFTGEDVVELQVHGGPAVLDAVFEVLASVPAVRPAEAGEFTRRAVLNGKLDLTAAEGLLDLVDSETESQRIQALRQLRGGLARIHEDWRERLVKILAYAEASIDFSDEELPEDLMPAVLRQAAGVRDEIQRALLDGRRGERIREGFRVAVLGPPNVGKSSLVNWLAGRDVAIVTEQAGTTRDVIEVRLNLGGYPVIVADTAGLRDTDDHIEAEGVRRAVNWAGEADVILRMIEAQGASEVSEEGLAADLVVVNKIDLGSDNGNFRDAVRASVKTGVGLQDLLERLEALVQQRMDREGSVAITRLRHRQALEACVEALDRAVEGMAGGQSVDLITEDLRIGTHALGRVTGQVDVEMLLDVVFRDFCIGK